MRAGIQARIFSGDFSASLKRAISSRSIRISWDTLALTMRLSLCQKQVEVVRKIFDLYLQGLSLGQIKSIWTGKDDWNAKTIRDMLKNEKYKGDTLLQKTYTEDFMIGKKSSNNGQRTQYYVKDSHPAIVSAEVNA